MRATFLFSLVYAILQCFIGSTALAQNFERGKASYYADHLTGRQTASGEPYDPNRFTAAHRSLPFGTVVRVQNIRNGRVVDVKINDRKSRFNRILELSRAAARELDLIGPGVGEVTSTVVGRMPINRPAHQPNTGHFQGSPTQPYAASGPAPSRAAASYPASMATSAHSENCSNPNCPYQRVAASTPRPPSVGPVHPTTPLSVGPVHPSSTATTPYAATQTRSPYTGTHSRPTADTSQSGHYRVQFGAFSNPANAERLLGELRQRGVDATIINNGLNRVVTRGVFKSSGDAAAWMAATEPQLGIGKLTVTN
ncbi:MAG: septal ring lytic transglycosylase RlpA family protein [Verrucomicrobiota bacterium]